MNTAQIITHLNNVENPVFALLDLVQTGQITFEQARAVKAAFKPVVHVGSRVTRTSYAGFVMNGTVTAIKRIGSMMYADIKNDWDEHTTQSVPVGALAVLA